MRPIRIAFYGDVNLNIIDGHATDAAERMASTDWDAERRIAQAYVGGHHPLEPVVEACGDLVLGGLASP